MEWAYNCRIGVIVIYGQYYPHISNNDKRDRYAYIYVQDHIAVSTKCCRPLQTTGCRTEILDSWLLIKSRWHPWINHHSCWRRIDRHYQLSVTLRNKISSNSTYVKELCIHNRSKPKEGHIGRKSHSRQKLQEPHCETKTNIHVDHSRRNINLTTNTKWTPYQNPYTYNLWQKPIPYKL